MKTQLTLISHALCPYVQRAAIVLMEKGVEFSRRDVDLRNKPDWFTAISPLGKTPVLQVDGDSIFESAVICEFLDETHAPRLHPEQALERAHHRSWIEFASALLNAIGVFYNSADAAALAASARTIRIRFEQIEAVLGLGPYFSGGRFTLVDAAFAPVFRYFEVFGLIEDFGFFCDLPKVSAWRVQLSARDSVRRAVHADYPARLLDFLRDRGAELSRRMSMQATKSQGVKTRVAMPQAIT